MHKLACRVRQIKHAPAAEYIGRCYMHTTKPEFPPNLIPVSTKPNQSNQAIASQLHAYATVWLPLLPKLLPSSQQRKGLSVSQSIYYSTKDFISSLCSCTSTLLGKSVFQTKNLLTFFQADKNFATTDPATQNVGLGGHPLRNIYLLRRTFKVPSGKIYFSRRHLSTIYVGVVPEQGQNKTNYHENSIYFQFK